MSPAIEFDLTTPELEFTASGDALVSRTVHPSGVRILTEEVPGALSASIGFWIAVGSRDEDQVAYGSTHFLEHLLFKGTSKRTALDIAIAFDEVGGEHNAMTAKEHTCYYAKVQDHDLGMAIDVLADMVADSVLDATEFDIERTVILEELAMADDDPSDVAHERIMETVLGDHVLGRPIGGNPATIKAATRESVSAHYQRYYQPFELVVTAAGGLKHAEVVARVLAGLEASGWDLSKNSAPAARRSKEPATLASVATGLTVTRPLEQAVVALATPGLRASDERRHAFGVMSQILGGGNVLTVIPRDSRKARSRLFGVLVLDRVMPMLGCLAWLRGNLSRKCYRGGPGYEAGAAQTCRQGHHRGRAFSYERQRCRGFCFGLGKQ